MHHTQPSLALHVSCRHGGWRAASRQGGALFFVLHKADLYTACALCQLPCNNANEIPFMPLLSRTSVVYVWQSTSGCGWGVGSGGGTGGKSQANSLDGRRLAMAVCDAGDSRVEGRHGRCGGDRVHASAHVRCTLEHAGKAQAGRQGCCTACGPTSKHTSTRSQACITKGGNSGRLSYCAALGACWKPEGQYAAPRPAAWQPNPLPLLQQRGGHAAAATRTRHGVHLSGCRAHSSCEYVSQTSTPRLARHGREAAASGAATARSSNTTRRTLMMF